MDARTIGTALRRVVMCSLAVLAITPLAWSQTTHASEAFFAFAVNMGHVGPRGARTVDISIERWLTDGERDVLRTALVEKGPDGLLAALKKTPRVGYLRLPGHLGYDLHYAMQVPFEGGGRRILLATDRRIGFLEARNRGTDTDYPFTLIELRVDADGNGEGTMAMAAQVTLNAVTHAIEIENYSSEPVRLNAVRKR